MRTSSLLRGPVAAQAGLIAALLVSGCHVKRPSEQRFYDQHIQPIFTTFCVGGTSPCHRADDTTHLALGNLDLSSFEAVQKRRDVLRTYGSYPQPLLLLKALPEDQVLIPFQARLLPSEIRHAGGKPISSNADAFYELKRWLDNGANRDGIAPVGHANSGSGPCNDAVPAGFVASGVDTTSPAYQTFQSQILPKVLASCAFGTCHSSPQSDFYVTCASDPVQQAFDFAQAVGFVVPTGTNVEQSELLLRPLSSSAGGVNHTGGVFFQSRNDETWKAWRDWATQVQALPAVKVPRSPGQDFFEANVMPKLLQRGCALEGCHSPNGFNDYRLRPGAQGFLAPAALKRNYEATRDEFMALDSVDVRQSRAVKKNVSAASGGIVHRGGALLEDETPSTVDCPAFPTDPAAIAAQRAYCIVKEWHRLERQDHAALVSPLASGDVLPLAFVSRPPNDDNLLQFDTYRGGADLKLADATLGANGKVTSVANVRSGLTACAGLAGKDVDVRGPEWSYDAGRVIFAARPGEASGLDLWLLDVAAGSCRQLTTDGGRLVNTVRVHNFDPVFAPDGSVAFASTRAGTLTLKNFLPNADLFRVGPALTNFGQAEQMTFLLNSELSPAFMQDGRLSFTAEKASAEFYQLSGRRINWDLTDYHPLLAQRAVSTDTFSPAPHPSVGYQQATEIREALDRNFLVVLSDFGAKGGGGALATFNRSVGPFEADRPEVTFLKSLVIVDAAATGRAGTAGVYRSPFSLPNGDILASYAANVTDPAAHTPKYALVDVQARLGGQPPLASDPSLSYVEAVLGYKRSSRLLFKNLPQLVFGGRTGAVSDDAAIMHFPDLPLLATLLGANLRQGRNVAGLDGAAGLRVYRELPPPGPGAGDLMGSQQVFTRRDLLGVAPLESDHSLKVMVPARQPLIFEIIDGGGKALFTMSEEHQVTPGEYITPGAPRGLFNAICAGCHGSISGRELDVAVSADALTGASTSASRDRSPRQLQ